MKTKHHFIRKMIFDGWCKLVKIPTKMNTADMATKILPSKTVSIFSKVVLGIEDDKSDHSLAIDDCRFYESPIFNWGVMSDASHPSL
jgi:hypothetical protein